MPARSTCESSEHFEMLSDLGSTTHISRFSCPPLDQTGYVERAAVDIQGTLKQIRFNLSRYLSDQTRFTWAEILRSTSISAENDLSMYVGQQSGSSTTRRRLATSISNHTTVVPHKLSKKSAYQDQHSPQGSAQGSALGGQRRRMWLN